MTAHILLIEDDEDLRAEIREFFKRRKNTVYDCATISDAQQAFRKRPPDIVVSDINLPDGDGAQFCVAHAAQNPNTSWLLMSGDPDRFRQSRQLRRAPAAPPFSVLEKPVSMGALDEFVRLAMLLKATSARTGYSEPRES